MDHITQPPAPSPNTRSSPSEAELESIKSNRSKQLESSSVEDSAADEGAKETEKPPLERFQSVVSSDGKARSKWRLIAIVTALFVKPAFQYNMLY